MKRGAAILLLIFAFMYVMPISGEVLPTQLPGEETYLAFAEEMPAPIGGLEDIFKKITYPAMAKKTGVEGKVYVLTFINENGEVDDVKVVKGIGAGCDEAVIDAVKSSKFKPGSNKGVPVKVKLSLAFNFKLK